MNVRPFLAVVATIASFTCVASDRIRPNDPAQRLEVLINKGLEMTKSNFSPLAPHADAIYGARSIFLRAGQWTSKSVLNVCFWNGNLAEQQAVAKSALRWDGKSKLMLSLYSSRGVPRKCTSIDSGDIRIALSPAGLKDKYEYGQDPGGNWSLIGKQSTFVPQGKADSARYAITMNLPQVGSLLAMGNHAGLDFTVGHEFGHALGLLHEFQAGICMDWIDIKKFAADEGWYGPVAIRSLDPLPLLEGTRFEQEYGTKGSYDVDSIMQYNFPSQYYISRSSQANPCRRVMDVSAPSPGDFQTVVEMYGAATGSPPVLDDRRRWRTLPPAPLDARQRLTEAYAKVIASDPLSVTRIKNVVDALEQLDQFAKGRVQP